MNLYLFPGLGKFVTDRTTVTLNPTVSSTATFIPTQIQIDTWFGLGAKVEHYFPLKENLFITLNGAGGVNSAPSKIPFSMLFGEVGSSLVYFLNHNVGIGLDYSLTVASIGSSNTLVYTGFSAVLHSVLFDHPKT